MAITITFYSYVYSSFIAVKETSQDTNIRARREIVRSFFDPISPRPSIAVTKNAVVSSFFPCLLIKKKKEKN